MKRVLIGLIHEKQRNLIFHEAKRFAGHSKWANIKHTKALMDHQRSVIFRKLSARIRIAIKEGGSNDPFKNAKLASVIEDAKKANMPAATIKKNLEATEDQVLALDLQGPGSVLMIVHLQSENHVIAKQNLVSAVKKVNAKVAHNNSLKKYFEHVYSFLGKKDCTLDQATEDAINAEAENVQEIERDNEKYFEFTCNPEYRYKVEKTLLNLGYDILASEPVYLPKAAVELDEGQLAAVEAVRKKVMSVPGFIKIDDNIL